MNHIRNVFIAAALLLLISCAGLKFNAAAYNDDIAIKNKAVELVKKANENYASHAAEADALKADVMRALENEKSRKGNSTTVAMWNEVINGKGNLFDLLNLWKTSNQLSPTMTNQSVPQIERLLNSIADLENFKKK